VRISDETALMLFAFTVFKVKDKLRNNTTPEVRPFRGGGVTKSWMRHKPTNVADAPNGYVCRRILPDSIRFFDVTQLDHD